MFVNKEPYIDYWENTIEDTSMDKVKKRKAIYNAKKEEIERLQYEYNLIEEDLVRTYKNEVTYDFMFCNSYAKDALTWIKCLKNNEYVDGSKLDKRKNYEEKTSYNFLVENLRKYLGEEIELVDIYDYNFGQAKEYLFTYKGYDFELDIPCIQGCTLDKFRNYGEYIFKLSLAHRPSKSLVEHFYSTFEEDTLKDALEKKVTELEGKKE